MHEVLLIFAGILMGLCALLVACAGLVVVALERGDARDRRPGGARGR